MNLQESIRRILKEDKKTKSTNKEFSKYKDSKFNSLRDYTLQDIVDDWDSLSDHKNENIKTIKHFVNNPDKITDLVYDEKGLEDGYHRLIAAKILKKPRFSYRLVENLQENIRRILKEESVKTELIKMIKDDGINSASSIVGGVNNLMEVMGIKSPMGFLNIYNDVEVLKSEKHPTLTLYRYAPKRNIMTYSKVNNVIYVNYDEVFLVFREVFMIDVIQSKEIVRKWATHQFNIPPQVRVEMSKRSTLMITI